MVKDILIEAARAAGKTTAELTANDIVSQMNKVEKKKAKIRKKEATHES